MIKVPGARTSELQWALYRQERLGRRIPCPDLWGGAFACVTLRAIDEGRTLRVLVTNGDDGGYEREEPWTPEGHERWLRWINAQGVMFPLELTGLGFRPW